MILFLLLSTILAILIVRQYLLSRRLPPGPTSLPLIGNVHQLVYHVWRNKGLVEALDYFRQTYGDVFTLWLGPIPHVSICDYETSQEVFVKNGNKYKDRFVPPIFEHISGNLGLVSSNGETWAEMRRFALGAFRTMGVGRSLMEERILDELDARCAEIDADAVDGKTVVHTSSFFDITVGSVINNILVGKRYDEHNKQEFIQIKGMFDSIADLFTVFDLFVPVWFLQKFFPRRFERFVEAVDNINNFVSREATERYEKLKEHPIDPENPQSFVEAYLLKMEEEKESNMYTMKCLRFVIGDLWLAGQDTTTTTLVSGFNQLVNHPEVVRKCREELMSLTDNGCRPLSLKDKPNAHYLNATIAEVQRHASILSVNFWRINYEKTTVKGFPVDAGALITAQLGALHVNEDIFKNADKFYPDRFIEEPKLLNQLIPFGIGKRSCAGENLARTAMFLIFGNLLLRYDIKPHGVFPSTKNTLPYGAGKLPDKTVKLEFLKL